MFDVGFSELVLIGLVALVVLGPERLPKVARTAGHLLGRLQRYVNDVKADINREMQLEELRKLQTEMEDSARSIETSVNQELRSVETSLNESIAPAESGSASASSAPVDERAASTPSSQETEHSAPENLAQLELGFEAKSDKKTA